jgi:uncharacterized RDD family membrane protein YckC
MPSSMSTSHTPESISVSLTPAVPGLFRRMAAGCYDALIMLAICIVATLLIVPFVHERGFDAFYARHTGLKLLYQLGLLSLGYAFFGGFWTHGGQTIGMRAWKLRVVCLDGAPMDWYRALIRYLSMLIPWLLLLGSEFLINANGQPGIGVYTVIAVVIFILAFAAFVWPALDPRHLAWHDHLSGTRLLLVRATRKQA